VGLLLVLFFIVLPVAELVVIVQVASSIGVGNTLALLLIAALFGGWLAKRSGIGLVRTLTRQVGRGTMPAKELLDGVLLAFAGILLFVPGFITDAVGLLLLLPPVRAGIRPLVTRRVRRRVDTVQARTVNLGRIRHTVVDVEGHDDPSRPRRDYEPPALP
jgi:UPF0716 protein FxsA